jgi:hypothetical protein
MPVPAAGLVEPRPGAAGARLRNAAAVAVAKYFFTIVPFWSGRQFLYENLPLLLQNTNGIMAPALGA